MIRTTIEDLQQPRERGPWSEGMEEDAGVPYIGDPHNSHKIFT